MRKRRAYKRKGKSRGLFLMAGLWLLVAAAAWALGGQGLSGGAAGHDGAFVEGAESGAEAGLRYLGTALPAVSRGLEEARSIAESAGPESAGPESAGPESAGPESTGLASNAENAGESPEGHSFLQGMVELSFPAINGETAAAEGPMPKEGPAANAAEAGQGSAAVAGGGAANPQEAGTHGAAAPGRPDSNEAAPSDETGGAAASDTGAEPPPSPAGAEAQAAHEAQTEEEPLTIVDSGSGGEPLVLIYHTHATESYQPVSSGNFHSLEEPGTVREVGNVLTAALEARGIPVVHDKTLHDNPSYNQSYSRSLETAKALLAEYPTVEIVIDLHRDAAAYSGGEGKTFFVNGATAAQFSLVVGMGNGNANQLLDFAGLVAEQAETLYPGFADRIIQKDYKYNQYVSNRYLLLEMGNNQNTIEEAKLSARYFADVIAGVMESQ